MISEPIVMAVIDVLEHLSVPYLVVGSFSSNVYGIPRSTKDADFVVQLDAVSVGAVVRQLGPDFELDPQMSFETITGTSRYRIRHTRSAFTIELFLLSDDPHAGREAYVASAEDVIIMKLRWSRHGRRSKDVEDVESVMSVQRDKLDWDFIHRWCDAHGTRELLDRVRASLPPA